jgi:subtilisin family serine protease
MNHEEEAYTVTRPATAASAISVAAYTSIGDGDIDPYSGWGPRHDGRSDVDITAPGRYVFSADPFFPGDFSLFSGTSGAGPHVAGAAALLKELAPDLDNGRCRELLRDGAGQDAFTTDPDRWGAGKLRIYAAISALLSDVADEPRHPGLQMAAHPNPFNPATNLRFNLPATGDAQLRVFDISGREVWSRVIAPGTAGWREITWNGTDVNGRVLSSGMYFAHVVQGPHYAVTKVTLLK